MSRKMKTYDVTKIFRSGKHWTDVINGKTETIELVREMVDNPNISGLIISYAGKSDNGD